MSTANPDTTKSSSTKPDLADDNESSPPQIDLQTVDREPSNTNTSDDPVSPFNSKMPGADVKLDFTFTPTDNGLQDNFFFSLDDLPEEDFNIYKAPISYPYLKGYLPTVAKITVPALAHRQFSMHSPAKSFSIGGYEHFPLTEEQQANFNFTV